MLTTTEFLASVKRGNMIPTNQQTITDADILAFADEEISTQFLPMITAQRQDYFVRSDDIAVVAGQTSYSIPSRAIGRTLRHILFKRGTEEWNLDLISIQHKSQFQGRTGDPEGFYFKGDEIIIVPTPSSTSGYLEVWTEFAPSNLILTTSAAEVASINSAGGTVTVESVPTEIVTGVLVDFLAAKPGHSLLGYDVTVSNVSSTTLTVGTANIPSKLQVGDWIALAGYSPVIMIPSELHQALAQAVQSRCLEALSDFEGMASSDRKLQTKMKAAASILSPRIISKPKKIVNKPIFGSGRGRNTRGF